MVPRARYAKSGDFHIAYVVAGDGPIDIVWVPTWISQVEHLWSDPELRSVFERLSSFARLIMFDRRGAGLSDPMEGAPTLEEQMDDVLAVMEAAGSERAAVCGLLEGGQMATMFAATHPERTEALVLYATFARTTWAPDYDFAWPAEERAARQEDMLEHWGEGLVAGGAAPTRLQSDDAFRRWAGALERLAASPKTIRQIMEVIGRTDVRDVLATIRVPTLIMHRREDSFLNVEHSRYLAKHIPGARYVELEGADNLISSGDKEAVLGEIEEFLTGTRHQREPDRVLATVLFTDIVGSTQRAAELGDSSWRNVLERHDQLVRREIERHRGRAVKSTGDGVLATFDGPARAIRAASSIDDAVEQLGIQIRAGLHTGECEVIGDDVGGLAVHIGARVMGEAGPGEVLVSSTVKDLVVGSGIEFEERGARELKGVPGEWRLFSVKD
jgi:class 3 adenylate cyclase